MSDRDGFQPGVPCWVDTWQSDADGAADFYSAVFGWECVGEPGGPYMCRSRGRDAAMIAQYPPEDAHRPAAWMAYVQVEDLDPALAGVRAAGGSVPVGPIEALDGGRVAIVADPDGGHVGLWQLGRHRGAQVVNEPGAWSFAQLHTRDPQAAKRFYGEVFGWEPEPFGELTMFRLPGYVGGEPEQPVPRDVVAGMQPLEGDGLPPHWRIDFWVSDLDAVRGYGPLARRQRARGAVRRGALPPGRDRRPRWRSLQRQPADRASLTGAKFPGTKKAANPRRQVEVMPRNRRGRPAPRFVLVLRLRHGRFRCPPPPATRRSTASGRFAA